MLYVKYSETLQSNTNSPIKYIYEFELQIHENLVHELRKPIIIRLSWNICICKQKDEIHPKPRLHKTHKSQRLWSKD